jgi:hypothetical protein
MSDILTLMLIKSLTRREIVCVCACVCVFFILYVYQQHHNGLKLVYFSADTF